MVLVVLQIWNCNEMKVKQEGEKPSQKEENEKFMIGAQAKRKNHWLNFEKSKLGWKWEWVYSAVDFGGSKMVVCLARLYTFENNFMKIEGRRDDDAVNFPYLE